MKNMQNNQLRPKSRYDKLKTLCTLDTSDIVLTSDVKQIIHKTKYQPTTTKNKTHHKTKLHNNRHSISLNNYKPQTNSTQKYHKPSQKHQTISTQKYYPNTKTLQLSSKKYKEKHKQRVKTQYSPKSPTKILLQNLQIFTNLKNVNFHMDTKYNVDPFYLVNTVKSTKDQTIQTVKKLDKNYRPIIYTLKKSNNPKIIEKYEKQILIKNQLTDNLKPNERKNLSCIHKVYKKDNQQNLLVLYDIQGESLSWKKSLSKKLIHNLPKNDMQILKHLIVQLSKGIHILSDHGYYHSEIRLKSVLVELKEDDENVKVSKLVKLGNLGSCYHINDKKSFNFMPFSLYTPPQILNFIIFENQNKNFNRQWLEYIYKYEHAWRISVWSLGILILQLLNEEPLQNTFLSIHQVIEFQKHIHIKCLFLFEKINDPNFQKLLKRMLSTNPQQRPSPQQIILCFTA